MYKIAVMGDRDSIYGFASVGLDTYPVTNPEHAAVQLKKLAGAGYAIIYITEALLAQLPEELERYRSRPIPAIIPIPGVTGNTGLGMSQVKKSVEQAVGADILFGNE